MIDCPECHKPVDGATCTHCGVISPPARPPRAPIPNVIREHLDAIKAMGRNAPKPREPGEEG